MKGDIYIAAMLGGIFSGLLSGIPGFNLGNCLCCLWVISGGIFSIFLYQKSSTIKLDAGDGFAVGALAGVIGALVATPLDLIFSYWTRGMIMKFLEAYGGEIRAYQNYFTAHSFAANLSLRLIIFAIFSAIGGAIGTALFKPKADSNS